MTYAEFKTVMEEKNVRHHRINGFDVRFSGSYFIKLYGRIPLSLARKISEGIDNNLLHIRVQGGADFWLPDDVATNAELEDILSDMCESELFDNDDLKKVRKNYIQNLEVKNQLDDVYITSYHIDTVEGLCHVIDCIRQGNYENECIFYGL